MTNQLWANALDFSGHEAACLIVGISPNQSSDESSCISHIIGPIRAAYTEAFAQLRFDVIEIHHVDPEDLPELAPPEAQIYSKEMCLLVERLHRGEGAPLKAWLLGGQNQFETQRFAPKELARWIFENKVQSAYSFAKAPTYVRDESRVAVRKHVPKMFSATVEADFHLETQRCELLRNCEFGTALLDLNELKVWPKAVGLNLWPSSQRFIPVTEFLNDRLMEATCALTSEELLIIAHHNPFLHDKFCGDYETPNPSENHTAVRKLAIASETYLLWCDLLKNGLAQKLLQLFDFNKFPVSTSMLNDILKSAEVCALDHQRETDFAQTVELTGQVQRAELRVQEGFETTQSNQPTLITADDRNAPQFSVTREALVSKHKASWISIEVDLSNAARNGLAAAKAESRRWQEDSALKWAHANNKYQTKNNTEHSIDSAMKKLVMDDMPVTMSNRINK